MSDSSLRLTTTVPLDGAAAFDALLDELVLALARRGLRFEPGPEGRVLEGGAEVGRVLEWEPRGTSPRARLAWRAAPWNPDARAEVLVRVDPAFDACTLSLELSGLDAVLGWEPARERLGWFAGAGAALLQGAAPAALGDWVTDRLARRPSGAYARGAYADPIYHLPNFAVILEELALGPEDVLVEVGCGGGALLHSALASGCRAAAIDHSPDMVRLARETNAEAIAAGRLEIVEGDAARLPFPDASFTCAAMTGVLGFLPDPVAALREMRRVLRDGGRAVILGADPEMRGTPAAPEPMASRLHFYDETQLERIARAAGFEDVRVERRPMFEHARRAGRVAPEHLELFQGAGPRFLFLRKAAAAAHPAAPPASRA